MGAKCTIWAWRIGAPKIDRKQPMVLLSLLAIADIANDRTGRLWASHQYIADQGHLSPRSVRSAVATLEELGLIRTEPQIGAADVIWLCLTPVTIYERGPEPDEELTAWNPRKRRAARQDMPGDGGAGRGETPARTPAGGADKPKRTQEEENQLEANASVGQADEVRHAFELYNRMADKIGATRAAKLNDDRKRRLKARLKDAGGIEGWARALERIERSPFLTGQTHHHFSLTLDFLIQPSSFTKLIEGQYEDRNDGGGSPASPTAGADRGAQQHSARLEAMVDGAREALSRRRRWSVGG